MDTARAFSAFSETSSLTEDDREHLADLKEQGQIRSIESIYGKSILSPNPEDRGLDAAEMLKMGISPMEFLYYIMIGVITDATPDQISAAKLLLPYHHSPQPTKVKTEVSYDRKALELTTFFGNLPDALLDEIERKAAEGSTVH